jgi:type IX secretion system PorP/SprF family membrane protein
MLAFVQLMAQQDPMYGQYIFNNAVINPAQAGATEENQIGVLARRQWLGMDGAPSTNSLFFNTRLPKNLGLAGGLYTDKIGPVKEITFQGDLSTHIQMTDKWTFSGGIRAMVTNLSINLNTLQTNQNGDPNFNNNYTTGGYLNLGAGVLFSSDKFFVGASMPRLFTREVKIGITNFGKYQNHFYLYGGANLIVNEDFNFKPSILFKSVKDAPLQLDLNFIFNYKDILDIGPMIRAKEAIGFLAGYRINPKFYVGYMYEYPINDLNLISFQTHEISLRMLWQTKYKNRVKSPRFFL